MDFAVWHEGLEQGSGRWVIALQGDRVLLTEDDGSFYWRELSECKMIRVATPDQPRPVVVVPVPQQAGLVTPMLNRAMRRNGQN